MYHDKMQRQTQNQRQNATQPQLLKKQFLKNQNVSIDCTNFPNNSYNRDHGFQCVYVRGLLMRCHNSAGQWEKPDGSNSLNEVPFEHSPIIWSPIRCFLSLISHAKLHMFLLRQSISSFKRLKGVNIQYIGGELI